MGLARGDAALNRIRVESLGQRCIVAQVFSVPGVAMVLNTHAGLIRFTPLFFSKAQLERTVGVARKLAIRASQLRRAAGRRRFQSSLNAAAAQQSGARAILILHSQVLLFHTSIHKLRIMQPIHLFLPPCASVNVFCNRPP